MMMCTDSRFEIIAKAKKDILETTNINESPNEMKVLDDFLMRCWQMDWLERYEQQKVREWIPCSERLPNADGEYLCQIESCYGSYMDMLQFANDRYEVDEYDFDEKDGAGFYRFDSEYGFVKRDDVEAWMPLPPAYKGE